MWQQWWMQLVAQTGRGSEGVSLRLYRESDLESVVRLFTDSVHQLARDHYDAAQRDAWAPRPPDMAGWKLRLAGLTTLAAEAGGQLLGFICYEPDGHVDLLYTAPMAVRRGVASALYHEVEVALTAHGVNEVLAEASLVARVFFECRGFSVMEEQYVQRRGQTFLRYAMRKSLVDQCSHAMDR